MIVPFNQIIAAYDGSEGGEKAVELAVKLHKGFLESKLTIIHVFNEKVEHQIVTPSPASTFMTNGFYIDTHPVVAIEQTGFDVVEDTHMIVKNSVEQAESKILHILSANHTEAEFEILEGNTSNSICEYAMRIDASLIVVGNSGKSGLEKFFLGSTSSSIAKNAPCSVLIAK